MALEFLNEMKKENKEIRREQNKRYRQKNREILNLKKQRMYYQESLEKKQAKIQSDLNNIQNL
jgi:hypothetical protein